jgi:GMP synthase-like glutamine amidotransferase
MRLHYLQHVSFEDPTYILTWAKQNHHSITQTLLFKNESFPLMDDFDMLIIMGGPMGVHDQKEFPWLSREFKFITQAMAAHKKILGICLGAQILAHILGAKVTKNKFKEIGWFEVTKTESGKSSALLKDIPETFNAFHWHGDTFDLPSGAQHLAVSRACFHQAFSYGKDILGLQFHLESTRNSINKLIKNCKTELVDGPFIQRLEILLDRNPLMQSNQLMDRVIQNLIA